jgi:hypothetical protein
MSSAPAASLRAPLSIVPDTAGITNAFAAAVPVASQADHQMFHGLFVDSQRGGSGAPVATPLWSVPGPAATVTAAGAAAPPPASIAAGILDLFKDPVAGS